MKKSNLIRDCDNDNDARFNLSWLLHPAQAFTHPSEVLNDGDFTLSEKRAILASWASDACAVEVSSRMRRTPGRPPVPFDDILDALRELDRQAADRRKPVPHYKRVLDGKNAIASQRPSRNSRASDGSHLH